MQIWRSLTISFAGFIDGLDLRGKTKHNFSENILSNIITPFGFLMICLLFILLVVIISLESGTIWIAKKILRRPPKYEYFFVKFERRIERFLDEVDEEKFWLSFKKKFTKKEEYLYYKYMIKGFVYKRKIELLNNDQALLLDQLNNVKKNMSII